jgi:hypothetical protein
MLRPKEKNRRISQLSRRLDTEMPDQAAAALAVRPNYRYAL